MNFASDTVSGYAVNSIAIEVPIALLTRTGAVEPADVDRRHDRRVGHDVAAADDRAPRAAAGSELGRVQSGAAHGQPADQRAGRRHGLQGPLQHGPAEERQPVRELLPRSAAAARDRMR